jgi:hypothetical protein
MSFCLNLRILEPDEYVVLKSGDTIISYLDALTYCHENQPSRR